MQNDNSVPCHELTGKVSNAPNGYRASRDGPAVTVRNGALKGKSVQTWCHHRG